MDRKWRSALILIPLILIVLGIWALRGGPESGTAPGADCTSPPGRPTSLAFNVAPSPTSGGGAARVSLTWVPPSAGDPPTMYVIEAGSAPGATNVGNYVSNTPSFATDAPAGTYYGRVRAQNACGSSDPSNEVIVKVP